MAKWYNIVKRYKGESKSHKRFYSSRDMMELKRMISVANSEAKRGLRKPYKGISPCGCGMEGCFILYS